MRTFLTQVNRSEAGLGSDSCDRQETRDEERLFYGKLDSIDGSLHCGTFHRIFDP